MNTRNKRSSAIMPGLPWRGMLPVPDGTVDQADRLQTAFMYASVFTIAAVFVDGITNVITSEPRNRIVVSTPRDYLIASEDRNAIVTSESRNRAVVSRPRNYRVPTDD